MEEKCKYDNIDMEKSKTDTDSYHIDVNTFNNNQKTKLYNIKDNKKIELAKTYYAVTEKKSQCNNITEQWQKWFTTSYYYLGNRDGRYNEIASNVITYDIPNGCYNACKDDYIINSIYKCENKKTFEYGKYKKCLPHDPLAIICILGSYFKGEYIHKNNIKGNYYFTLDNLLYDGVNNRITDENTLKTPNPILETNRLVNIDSTIRHKLLDKINASDTDTGAENPVNIIKANVAIAYNRLVKYIDDIVRENESNAEKIINNIKKDIGVFYNLFDKRDELYIKYLNDFNLEKKKYNLSYVHSLATLHATISERITASSIDIKLRPYIKFLFNYSCFACFSATSIFAERLELFGIYDKTREIIASNNSILILGIQTTEDENVIKTGDNFDSGKIRDDTLQYKIKPIKLESETINIFEEYSYIFKLYKSFLIVYPTVFTIILSVLFFLLVCYILDKALQRALTKAINYIYAFILYLNLVFKYSIGLNVVVIWVLRNLKWYLVDSNIILTTLKYMFNEKIRKYLAPLFGLIFVIILIYIFATKRIEEIILIIPKLLVDLIYFVYLFIFFIIRTTIHVLFTFKPTNIFAIGFTVYILYVYYYTVYMFNYEALLRKTNSKTIEGISNANGDSLIINTYNNEDACRIIWNRVELIKYEYLLDRYGEAYNILELMTIVDDDN